MYNLTNRLQDGAQFVSLWDLLKQIEEAEMAYIDDAARYLLLCLNNEPAAINHIRRRNKSGVVLPVDAKTQWHLLDQLNIFASHATLFDDDGMGNNNAQPTFEQFGCYANDIYPLLAGHDIAVSLPSDQGSNARVFPDGKQVPGWMLGYDHQPLISIERAIKVLIASVSDARVGSPKYDDAYETWEAALSDAVDRAAISVATSTGRRMLSHTDIHTWCMQHGYIWPLDASPALETCAPDFESSKPGTKTKPLQRQVYQEQEILGVLRTQGYDPERLPKSQPGKAGVKAEMRDRLKWTAKVFDKAWQRLRDRGEIGEA